MDQVKIGKFIALLRKEKGYTQLELAERLNITDRAISKWETGKGMPDVSIMLELCNLLDVNVNELLSGQRINMSDYQKQAEENLISLKELEESSNKKILQLYKVLIGLACVIAFVVGVMSGCLSEKGNTVISIALMVIAAIFLIAFTAYGIHIEQTTGYFECEECHYKYIPTYKDVLFSRHKGMDRKMKCPHCEKKTWNKKVMSK